jgi:hypothetical protein
MLLKDVPVAFDCGWFDMPLVPSNDFESRVKIGEISLLNKLVNQNKSKLRNGTLPKMKMGLL